MMSTFLQKATERLNSDNTEFIRYVNRCNMSIRLCPKVLYTGNVTYWVSQSLSLPHRLSMMDLIVAMAPFVDEATMTNTFDLIKPYLEVKLSDLFMLLKCFLLKYTCMGFVHRLRSQGCRRRPTVSWRRCVEERAKRVNHLLLKIWKHLKSFFLRL